MAVAKKKKELEPIAEADVAKKIDLEKKLAKDSSSFLKKIDNDFYNQYLSEGTVIDTRTYKPELIALLMLNYNRISNAFKYNIRESFDDKTSVEVDALINLNITNFQKQVADLKSDYILATTTKEISRNLANSTLELLNDGKEINRLNTAALTKQKLNTSVEGRATTIAITETQNMAESSKDIEEKTLINENVILGGIVLSQVLRDVWITNLDEKTREAHVMAFMQEKLPYEKFMVGGEFLDYPGDPAGSPANIMNCRCSMVSSIF